MRPSLLVLLVFEAAVISQALEDEQGSTAVFDLGHLVDDAQQFVEGAKVKDPAQSALERVEAMKNRLAKKLLNKEISKIPYSETELGEGMAVSAVKGGEKAYSSFKTLSKTIEGQKDQLRKKMLKATAKMTKAEKKELLSRKAAAELRKKLRHSVQKKKEKKAAKFKSEAARLKKELKKQRVAAAKALKLQKQKLKHFKKDTREQRRKEKKMQAQSREEDLFQVQKYKQSLQKHWYQNMKKIHKYKKIAAAAKDKIKDLTTEVKDNDTKFKEMEAGLKAQFLSKEGGILRKMGKKLKKQSKKTEG